MRTEDIDDKDLVTILMALKKRIDSLWSIEMSDKQKELRVRYKVLFEKLRGDYNRNYEYDFLKGEKI